MGGRVGECAGPASEIALSRFRKQPLRPRARLRIGSQQAHTLGLDSQLVERIVDRWIARLADHSGVEFGRREAPAALKMRSVSWRARVCGQVESAGGRQRIKKNYESTTET